MENFQIFLHKKYLIVHSKLFFGSWRISQKKCLGKRELPTRYSFKKRQLKMMTGFMRVRHAMARSMGWANITSRTGTFMKERCTRE